MTSAHDPGYQRPTTRVGRSSRWLLPIPVVVLALLVGLVAKPWAGAEGPAASARTPIQVPGAAATAVADAARPVSSAPAGVPAPSPAWPAASTPTTAAQAASIESMLDQLLGLAGSWGIADAGAGPRLIRDEPWTDWEAAVPEAATDLPIRVGMWPGTDACDRVPALLDRPSVVAVTTPADLRADRPLVGWWTDGVQVAALDGSLLDVTPTGRRGIRMLERADGAPWPVGRYELHLATTGSGHPDPASLAVAFCLRGSG